MKMKNKPVRKKAARSTKSFTANCRIATACFTGTVLSRAHGLADSHKCHAETIRIPVVAKGRKAVCRGNIFAASQPTNDAAHSQAVERVFEVNICRNPCVVQHRTALTIRRLDRNTGDRTAMLVSGRCSIRMALHRRWYRWAKRKRQEERKKHDEGRAKTSLSAKGRTKLMQRPTKARKEE